MQLGPVREIGQRFGFLLTAGGFTLLGLLPRNAAAAFCRTLARLWFALDRRHRRIAINNLTYVFGYEKSPVEIRAMARRVFVNIVWLLYEIGWAYRTPAAEIERSIRFSGLAHLRQAWEKGRGVLVLTAHLGSWELLVSAAAMLGYPVNIVYRPLDAKPLDLFFRKLRGRYKAQLLPKARAMRPLLKALRQRELVGILLDQNARRREGVFVDFFGKPASTNAGLALVARRTGAPVLPMFLVREGRRYRMVIEPEVPLVATGDKAGDIRANTRRYNQALESVIRRYPEQWFWVHQRWKRKPRDNDQGESLWN